MSSRSQQYLAWSMSIAVVAVVGAMFWPRTPEPEYLLAKEIRMVSPDGSRTLRITCQNNGAGVYISGQDGSRVVHLYSGDLGDQLTLGARSPKSSLIRLTTIDDTQYGAIPQPSIKLYSNEGDTREVQFTTTD